MDGFSHVAGQSWTFSAFFGQAVDFWRFPHETDQEPGGISQKQQFCEFITFATVNEVRWTVFRMWLASHGLFRHFFARLLISDGFLMRLTRNLVGFRRNHNFVNLLLFQPYMR